MANPKQNTPNLKRQAVDTWEMRKNSNYEKLDVVSHPTDPYINIAREATNFAPVEANPDVAALNSIFDNVNSTVKSYINIQEMQKPENRIKGASEAIKKNDINAKPEERPFSFMNLGAGYTEAFEEMQGKLDSVNYKNAVNEFTMNNSHLEPSLFQEKLKAEITAPYLQRQGLTPHQLAGLIPEVMAADQMAIGHNNTRYQKSLEIEKDALIGKNVDISIEGTLQTTLGLNSIEQLNDPKWKREWYKFQDTPEGIQKVQLLAKNQHDTFLREMSLAEQVGKTKAEFSKQWLERITQEAVFTASPFLLDYTKLKDKDGVSVADAYPDQVKAAYREAYAAEYKMKEAFHKEDVAAQKEKQRKLLNDYGDKFYGLLFSDGATRNSEALRLYAQFKNEADDAKIPTDDYNHMRGALDKIQKLGEFAYASDSPTMEKLWAKANRLTVAEVMAESKNLEEKDWLNLLRFAEGNMRKGQDKDLDYRRKALTDTMDTIVNRYKVTNVDGIVTPESAIVANQVKAELAIWLGRNANSATSDSMQKFWQDSIAKRIEIPTKVIDNEQRRTNAATAPTGGRTEYAPIGTQKKTKDGKIKTSDGKGGWH